MAEHRQRPQDPGHLPQTGESDLPAPPEELPRHRRGTTPQMRSRYPDFDVLEQADHWDEATRRVVLDRVERVPPIRFFTDSEAATLEAFCDTVTAQDAEPRIPVLHHVDEKLHEGRLDGYQYADMPDDRNTWRRVARGLDEGAADRGHASFADAPVEHRLEICSAFQRGELSGGAWDGMSVERAWSVVMRHVLSAFYAHPWSWNEIGFGGPAYPRGYARMGIDVREGWEPDEAFDIDVVQDVERRGLDR